MRNRARETACNKVDNPWYKDIEISAEGVLNWLQTNDTTNTISPYETDSVLVNTINNHGWMGTETGYASRWGAYYLGMNYPLRFTLFGGILTGAALMLGTHSICMLMSPNITSVCEYYGDLKTRPVSKATMKIVIF